MIICQSRQVKHARAVLSAALLALALTIVPSTALADEPVEDEQLVVVDEGQVAPAEEQVAPADDPAPDNVAQEAPADEQKAEGEAAIAEGNGDAAVIDDTDREEQGPDDQLAGDVNETIPAVVDGEDVADDEAADAESQTEGQLGDAAEVDLGMTATATSLLWSGGMKSPSGPIEDGLYTIETAVTNNQVVVANGGNTSNGTNVLTSTYSSATIKTWFFKYDAVTSASSGKDVYRIYVPDTNQVLAVSGSSSNVLLWEDLNSPGQAWILTGSHASGWNLASYKDQSLVLDMTGSSTGNATNIAVAQQSSSRATRQRFYLLPLKATAGSKVIEDGAYEVNAAASTEYVMAIGSSSTAAGASAILYTSTKSPGQKWQFIYDGEGYYTIIVLCSGKALAIPNADHIPGADARQYQITNSDAQKWAIYDNGGHYSIVNKNTGLYLAIAGGKIANSTNVLGWRPTGANSQKWIMTPVDYIEEGIFEIKPLVDSTLNLEYANASASTGARLGNDTKALNQRYQVTRVGTNQYKIRTGASGGWIANNGSSITQSGSSEDTAEVWEAFWNGNYFSMRNLSTNKVIDLSAAAASGVSTKASAENAASTQHFRFVPARLIEDGIYMVNSQVGTTLAIASGSTSDKANTVSWTILNSPAQKFVIQHYGEGYLIYNALSGMTIAPTGTSNCNVNQRTITSVSNQIWIPEISDGGYVTFKNAATGQMLAVANSNPGSNSNVVMWSATGSQGQNWKPVASTYYGWCHRNNGKGGTYHWSYISADPRAHFDYDLDSTGKSLGHYDVLYRLWYRVNGYKSGSKKPYGSNTNYLIVSAWDDCYLGVFVGVGNPNSAGYWQPLYGWNCGNGNRNVINEDAIKQAEREGRTTTWSWDPEWDYALALNNDTASRDNLPDNNQWARPLSSSNYRLLRIPNNNMERYFTSVRMTLGYHSTITSNPSSELGRHVSHGCIRLDVNNARTLYALMGTKGKTTKDLNGNVITYSNGQAVVGVGPGTRCIQLSSSKGSY